MQGGCHDDDHAKGVKAAGPKSQIPWADLDVTSICKISLKFQNIIAFKTHGCLRGVARSAYWWDLLAQNTPPSPRPLPLCVISYQICI